MSFNWKTLWIRADSKLKTLIPTIKQLCDSELQLPRAQQNPIFSQFFKTLTRGSEIMGRNISSFVPFLTYRYASQILCIEDEVYENMDLIPAHLLSDIRKLKQELQYFYQDLLPEDMRSMLKDIKGYFQNLLFIVVLESPNGKGLLETMLNDIVGRKRSEFQNVEGAFMQQQLLGQSKSTLLTLDDVGSRANLEKLLFQVAGYKTLFTTRDTSIIPRNHSTQFYQDPLLGLEEALSLFCFWASGQMPIPSNGDAILLNKVQPECRSLLFALKLIRSCLHGEPYEVREIAKNKLCRGELVSDFHTSKLHSLLQTSIRFLANAECSYWIPFLKYPYRSYAQSKWYHNNFQKMGDPNNFPKMGAPIKDLDVLSSHRQLMSVLETGKG